MVWAQNGVPTAALGTNIWTSGAVLVDDIITISHT